MGELRPRGDLLNAHYCALVVFVNYGVELLYKLDRLKVLLAAQLVGDPLAALFCVVEIEH